MTRAQELALNLADVRARVEAACVLAGREPADVNIITVTKTWPSSDIQLLAQLGVVDIGESRDQEASAKFADCGGLGLRWHFIGQFQTNKANRIARYADVVHSLDRPKAVHALEQGAALADRSITGLVQVSLDKQAGEGRAGASPDEVVDIATEIVRSPHLRLGGVMAVAPIGTDPGLAFQSLAEVSAQLREHFPEATMISAGMSEDLTEAIAHGATHLRIGSAIMGSRSYVQ